MHVALTGASGFLGSELLRILCLNPEVSTITAFLPESNQLSPAEKIARLQIKWQHSGPSVAKSQLAKVNLKPLLLGFPWLQKTSPQRWDYFIHLAGLTDLNPSISVARRTNVFGTQHALRLAASSPTLTRFVHLSTAYVCGQKERRVDEADTPNTKIAIDSNKISPIQFNNHYERSKFEAEQSVVSFGLPYTIIRPSIIVGRSFDGYFPQTKVIYSLWRAWLRGIAPRIPVDPSSVVDLVPLDWVCAVILALMSDDRAEGETFHASAGTDRQNNLNLISLASRIFGLRPPKTCPRRVLELIQLPFVANLVPYHLSQLIAEFAPLLNYMSSANREFSMEKTNSLLASQKLTLAPFNDWGQNLFSYCKSTNWGKNTSIKSARSHAMEPKEQHA